ncbi:hypothetical protein, partial [Rhodoferax sp.]|uniref:hypothetical protein n=1 Tax=Rhodoferax sp. TaxID=50421 RepID=UPI00283FA7BC
DRKRSQEKPSPKTGHRKLPALTRSSHQSEVLNFLRLQAHTWIGKYCRQPESATNDIGGANHTSK